MLISVFLVSCEMSLDKDKEPQQKAEATGGSLNESIIDTYLITPNKAVIEQFEEAIEDLEEGNPKAQLTATIKAKDNKAFTFATEANYRDLKTNYAQKGYELPQDSYLHPSSYKEIKINASSDSVSITYTLSNGTVNTLNYKSNPDKDPLYLDAMAFAQTYDSEDGLDDNQIEELLTLLSTISPQVNGTVTITSGLVSYSVVFHEALTITNDKITLSNNISLNKSSSTLASFKCKLALSFEDIRVIMIEGTNGTTSTFGGKVSLEISDFTLTFAASDARLTADLNASVDFDQKKFSAEATIIEYIQSKEILNLDAAISYTEDDIDLENPSAIINNKLKIYTCKIAGTSYSADSVRAMLLQAVAQK